MVSKKLLFAAVLVGLPAAWVLYKAYAPPPRGPMSESIPADEDVHTAQIIASGVRMVNATRVEAKDGLYRRDAHAKAHGCALGTFTVKAAEKRLQEGVFAASKTYKAWVRFSSGSTTPQSDWKPDARGMAIKLMGVPGKKLLEGEEEAQTHDFVMLNNSAFFIRDVKEYASLTQFQGEGSQFGYFFAGSPAEWHLREFRIGLGILKWPPSNLLSTQFHSMTAYRFGTRNNVKYSAKPVACSGQASIPNGGVPWDKDGLRLLLQDELKAGPAACFDFMVQLQAPDKNMPVEDTTVLWSEKDSPFVAVARLELPKQDIQPARDSGFCENLSFTPWHALPEHRPIGGLNRVRKAVYQGIARYRRCMNGKFFGEPKLDGAMEFDTRACDPHEAAPAVGR